jgi:hypothetical protein
VKPNGKGARALSVAASPAAAHVLQLATPEHWCRCEICGALYDPRREGQDPTPWRLPECERCFLLAGRQAA